MGRPPPTVRRGVIQVRADESVQRALGSLSSDIADLQSRGDLSGTIDGRITTLSSSLAAAISIITGSAGLATVSHDTTLSGLGTSGSPLSALPTFNSLQAGSTASLNSLSGTIDSGIKALSGTINSAIVLINSGTFAATDIFLSGNISFVSASAEAHIKSAYVSGQAGVTASLASLSGTVDGHFNALSGTTDTALKALSGTIDGALVHRPWLNPILSGTIVISGSIAQNAGDTFITGTVYHLGNLRQVGSVEVTGSVTLGGGVGPVKVDRGSGPISVADTTQLTNVVGNSYTVLQAGITGSVNNAYTVLQTALTSSTSDPSYAGSLTGSGDARFGRDIWVAGNAHASGSITGSGDALLRNRLTVNGVTTFNNLVTAGEVDSTSSFNTGQMRQGGFAEFSGSTRFLTDIQINGNPLSGTIDARFTNLSGTVDGHFNALSGTVNSAIVSLSGTVAANVLWLSGTVNSLSGTYNSAIVSLSGTIDSRFLNLTGSFIAQTVQSAATVSGTMDANRVFDGEDWGRGFKYEDHFIYSGTLVTGDGFTGFTVLAKGGTATNNRLLPGEGVKHPGIFRGSVFTSGTNVSEGFFGNMDGDIPPFSLGRGIITWRAITRIPDVDNGTDNSHRVWGLWTISVPQLASDGVYFHLSRTRFGDNEFRFVTAATSSMVQVKTGVTAANNLWYYLQIESSPDGDAVTGSILCTGSLIATITSKTFVPTVGVLPVFRIIKSLGSSQQNLDMDYWSIQGRWTGSFGQ